jgi:hypothetical protein
MSLGEIDTLNLTFEKLSALFDESQGYYESFLDANNLYKAGKLSDKEMAISSESVQQIIIVNGL